MDPTDTRPGESSGEAHGASPGWGVAAVLWGTTLAIFWPALRWLLSVTLDQQQLLQSFDGIGHMLRIALRQHRNKLVTRQTPGNIGAAQHAL